MQINVRCLTITLKHFKSIGMVQKQGNWVPYELKPSDVERLVHMNFFFSVKEGKVFFHCIITRDEKQIHYDNPQVQKIMVQSWPNIRINSKAEYSPFKVDAPYLVGSERVCLFRAPHTCSNHYWGLLLTITCAAESWIESKTTGIWQKRQQDDFPAWQQSASMPQELWRKC